MKTLDRYIALSFLKNFFIAVAGLTLLYFFQALLSAMLDKEFTLRQVLVFNLYQVPQTMAQMAPPSVLLGTVLTLSGLNRTNELVAAYSIGVGLKRIMALFLIIVFAVCCMLLFLQDRLLPALYRKKQTYYWREMKKKQDFFFDVKKNKIWYRSRNLIYNLKTFDSKNKIIQGMTVYTFDANFNLLQAVEAESAKYTPQGWKLMNGIVTQFNAEDPFPSTDRFRELELQIPETPNDFQEIEKETEGLKLGELWRYIQQIAKAGLDSKAFLVNFHSRISLSFIPFVMCMIGFPFSVRGRREGGVAKDLVFCLMLTFFYWLFYSIGLSLGTTGAVPPIIAAWTPTVLFGVLAVFMVSRKQA